MKLQNVLIIGGIGALGGFFLFMKNKRAKEDAKALIDAQNLALQNAQPSTSTGTNQSNTDSTDKSSARIVKLSSDNGVYVVIGGRKYGFINETSLLNFGYKVPIVITKEEFDSIPVGGFVSNDGKIVQSADKGGRIIALASGTDPNNGVYVVVGGKKFGFISEKALNNYGYKTPEVVTKQDLDAIANGGFVGDDGNLVRTA